jgi:hypothetical protein
VFKFYLDAYNSGLDLANAYIFNELLEIGIAQSSSLTLDPIEWAKAHVQILLEGQLCLGSG